jgi:hypothetical protein
MNYQRDKDAMTDAVLSSWQARAPQTLDAPAALDNTANQIFPTNNRNCVAIAANVAGPPLVAMNTWSTTTLHPVYGVGAYTKVHDPTVQKHAEMKIIDYWNGNGPAPAYIGISKPCCLRCAVVLQIVGGIGNRGCGGGLWDAGWVIPDYITTNPGRLQNFMGGGGAQFTSVDGQVYTVWNAYSAIQQNSQRDFLSLLKNLKD